MRWLCTDAFLANPWTNPTAIRAMTYRPFPSGRADPYQKAKKRVRAKDRKSLNLKWGGRRSIVVVAVEGAISVSGQTECGALCDVLYRLIWVPGVLRDTMARAGRREAVDRGFEGVDVLRAGCGALCVVSTA